MDATATVPVPGAPAETTPQPGGLLALATMPPETPLDVPTLAGYLGVHPKSIGRQLRRGELPEPFRLGGRHYWMAGALLAHFGRLQAAALSPKLKRSCVSAMREVI